MKESVLKSLMRLFAIVSQVHSIDEIGLAREIVEVYLKRIVRHDKIKQYLIMFDFYHSSMRERENKTGEKQLSLFSVKAMIICEQANEQLTKKQKILVFIHILEILSATSHESSEDIDFVRSITTAFKLEESLFDDCFAFIFNKFDNINEKCNVLFAGTQHPGYEYKYLFKDFIAGKLVFLYLKSINTCLFKHIEKDDQLYFNDQLIELNTAYIFDRGGVLKSPLLGTLYFNDVIKIFLHEKSLENVVYTAKEVSYQFPDGEMGIEPFDLSEASGQLIGIMGGSGVGKSTLLNLLNGSIPPTTGKILLNGFDIHTEHHDLEGLIGYVPQEDLLIEELTVFQNLYYNARLCYKDDSVSASLKRVNSMLHMLDLYPTRNLKVGSPLNKLISGGQRKRLNIALELIREPYVMFIDEPTSGLSSNDSEKVIDHLKTQSLRGRLVVVNIHQPSSDIFKQFDKLIVLDSGGRFVFHGKPQDSLVYLKKYNQLINAEEGECPTCGNLNPEQILQILESKRVNVFGEPETERRVKPEEWYKNYQTEIKKELNPANEVKTNLPKVDFSVPSGKKQFAIFNIRNILTKLSDKQFILINLLEAPILAFILSWFTKYKAGIPGDPDAYIFSANINIPVYIFMSVVVAIFLGLMLSAEDIIRDRKLIKREAFLHLNRTSYYNAKIFLLAIILGIQIVLFVIIGNSFLKIQGMYFEYWLLLWMVSMVAGMVGLNISATMKTVVAIYILIPIVLVPQILLGGAMIRYDKLNKRLSNHEYVPLVGDIMPSRWAYEALIVNQFTKNKYQKIFYEKDKTESNASYILNYYLPALKNEINNLKQLNMTAGNSVQFQKKLRLINNELVALKQKYSWCFGDFEIIVGKKYNVSTHHQIERSVNCLREYYISKLSKSISEQDDLVYETENKLGGRKELLNFKNNHTNEKLAEIVLNKSERYKAKVTEDKITRLAEPIYYMPEMKTGRAHFCAPVKRVGNIYIDTYWFNLLMLVFMILVFYLTLIFDVFRRLSRVFSFGKILGYISDNKERLKNPHSSIVEKIISRYIIF